MLRVESISLKRNADCFKHVKVANTLFGRNCIDFFLRLTIILSICTINYDKYVKRSSKKHFALCSNQQLSVFN